MLGLRGIGVRDPEKLGAAWDRAFAADRPVIMNVYADPNVPPLPPHVTFKDAKDFLTVTASAPELGSVSKNSGKEILVSVLPCKHRPSSRWLRLNSTTCSAALIFPRPEFLRQASDGLCEGSATPEQQPWTV